MKERKHAPWISNREAMPLFKKLALCKSCHLFRCLNWLPRQNFPACTSLNIPFCPVTKSLSGFLVPNREDWSWMWQSVVNVNPDHTINPSITGWGEGGERGWLHSSRVVGCCCQTICKWNPFSHDCILCIGPNHSHHSSIRFDGHGFQ